jgi:hypothetical protein
MPALIQPSFDELTWVKPSPLGWCLETFTFEVSVHEPISVVIYACILFLLANVLSVL